MIERICPKCRVPMNGDKCIKPNCGCATKMSSTIYWCDDCNVPIFENICPSCGNKGRYIATDMRPVFPEENVLISQRSVDMVSSKADGNSRAVRSKPERHRRKR